MLPLRVSFIYWIPLSHCKESNNTVRTYTLANSDTIIFSIAPLLLPSQLHIGANANTVKWLLTGVYVQIPVLGEIVYSEVFIRLANLLTNDIGS